MRSDAKPHYKLRWVYVVVLAMVIGLLSGIRLKAETPQEILVGGMKVEFTEICLAEIVDGEEVDTWQPIYNGETKEVLYKLKLTQCKRLSTTSAIEVTLPEELKLIHNEEIPLMVNIPDIGVKQVGKCSFTTPSGVGVITFNEVLKDYERAILGFAIGVNINAKKIPGEEGKRRINFKMGEVEKGLDVNFTGETKQSQEQEIPPTITKTHDKIDEVQGEIRWCIHVSAGSKTLKDVVIKDTFSNEQLIFKALEKDGAAYIDYETNIEHNEETITIHIPELAAKMECDFVMITGIKNEIYEVDHSKVNISNIASLRDKEGSKLTEHDAKDWVEIEVNWISKSSQYWEELKDGVTIRKIDWTVTVNSNQQDMSGYLLSDYFPVGLELEKRSIKINDIPIDEMSDIGTISYITEEGNKAYWKQGEKKSFHYKGGIKYQFKESLIFDNAHKVYKLTYTTRITDSVQDSINKGEYYNLAGIGKGAGAGTGERVFYDYKGAGIRISDVTKRAQGYNTSSHEIIWQVVANRYNNSVKQICIQDTLPEGVKLNETTVKVNDQVINTEGKAISADGDIMAAYSYDQVNQQIICNIYSQSDKFFDQYYTLQFGTIVMEKSVYANNFEQGKDYINHVKVVYTDINDVLYTSPEKTASIKVTGQVLSKHIGDYNSQTGEMTWLIVVNHNRIAMENVIINDTLEEGQQYVEGKVVEGDYSAKSLEEIEGAGNAMPTLVPQVKEGEITYNLGNIHTTYTIVLKTKVDKANVFIPNKKVVLHNTVSINSPSIFEDVKPVVIEKEINNDFVLKAGKQVDTNMPLEWYLLVNPNQVSLKSIIVKDCLSEELMPKTESIEVFRVTALTKEIKGLTIEDVEGLDKQKIILAEEQINYNKTNHTISFALGDITACYLIKFQVIVTADQPAKQYTNKATIEGIKEESWKMDSKEIEVKTQFSRSWGRVELPTGTIEIMKLDEENLMPLKGAEFKLNDGICSMTVETDDTGKAIFNGLTLGKTYKLYESKAPEGYKLNDKVEMIKLDSTQIVQLEFINKKELPSVNPSPDVNGDKEYENNDGGKTYPIPVEVIKKDQEPTNPNSYQKPIKSVPEDQKNYKDSDVERNNLQVTDDLNDNRKNQAVESLVERKDILNNEETLPKTGGITGIDFTILLGSITMMMGVVVDYYRRKK